MFWVRETVQIAAEVGQRDAMPKKSRINNLQETLAEKKQELAALAEKLKKEQLKAAIEKSDPHRTLQKKMEALHAKRWKVRADLAKKNLSVACKERDLATLRKVIGDMVKEEAGLTSEYNKMVEQCKQIEDSLLAKLGAR